MAAFVTSAEAGRRLSEERLPGEPGPSTDGGRPTTTAQGHHNRSNSRRLQQLAPESVRQQQQQQQQAAYSDTAADDGTMITVAASGSRAPKPKPRFGRPPSSADALFPVDVTDRLRSSNVSSLRPRQYGRRRSVQEAIASAVALQQQQQQQLQSPVAVTLEPGVSAAAVDDDDGRQREQEPPSRLVTTLRLVHCGRSVVYYRFTTIIIKINPFRIIHFIVFSYSITSSSQ